jgi:flagellar motor switch protein FliM
MSGGACECLMLIPQALLLPFRNELAHDPEEEPPAVDRRWSRLMEVGVQQTRLPVTAILEEARMSLGDVANLRVGGVLPLQCNDFTAIRLECSGRGMFTCKLGQGDGRYRLEIESPIAQGTEAANR